MSNNILIDSVSNSKYDINLDGYIVKNVPFNKLHEILYFKDVIGQLKYNIESFQTNIQGYLLAYKYCKDYIMGISTDFIFIDKKDTE